MKVSLSYQLTIPEFIENFPEIWEIMPDREKTKALNEDCICRVTPLYGLVEFIWAERDTQPPKNLNDTPESQ